MFCSKCGNEVGDGVKFCGSCGNVMGGATVAVQDAPRPQQNVDKNKVLFSVLESPDKIKVMAEKMHHLHRANTMSLIEEELAKLIENDKQEKL